MNSNNSKAVEERAVVSSAEAAQILGISPRTLANWRVQGRGPAYVRIGKNRSSCTARAASNHGLNPV